jgi:hypothetical protein
LCPQRSAGSHRDVVVIKLALEILGDLHLQVAGDVLAVGAGALYVLRIAAVAFEPAGERDLALGNAGRGGDLGLDEAVVDVARIGVGDGRD